MPAPLKALSTLADDSQRLDLEVPELRECTDSDHWPFAGPRGSARNSVSVMTHDSGFGYSYTYLRFLLCCWSHSAKIVSDATNVHRIKLLLSADCAMPGADQSRYEQLSKHCRPSSLPPKRSTKEIETLAGPTHGSRHAQLLFSLLLHSTPAVEINIPSHCNSRINVRCMSFFV